MLGGSGRMLGWQARQGGLSLPNQNFDIALHEVQCLNPPRWNTVSSLPGPRVVAVLNGLRRKSRRSDRSHHVPWSRRRPMHSTISTQPYERHGSMHVPRSEDVTMPRHTNLFFGDPERGIVGPVTRDELLALRQINIITDETFVIAECGVEWCSFAHFVDFADSSLSPTDIHHSSAEINTTGAAVMPTPTWIAQPSEHKFARALTDQQPQRKPSALATCSCVLGLLSWTGILCFLCVPAVVCGHMALNSLRESHAQPGRKRTITGLITGYAVIGMIFVIWLAAIAAPKR